MYRRTRESRHLQLGRLIGRDATCKNTACAGSLAADRGGWSTMMAGNVRGMAPKQIIDRAAPLVIIVEDDEGVREGLQDLLHSVGLDTLAYDSTSSLLTATLPDRPGCLVLDVRLPGSSGLDLQAKLTARGNRTACRSFS